MTKPTDRRRALLQAQQRKNRSCTISRRHRFFPDLHCLPRGRRGSCSYPNADFEDGSSSHSSSAVFAALSYCFGIASAKLVASFGQWTPLNWRIGAAVMLIALGALAFMLRGHIQIACASAFLSLAIIGSAPFSLGSTHSVRRLPADLENQEFAIEDFITRTSAPV